MKKFFLTVPVAAALFAVATLGASASHTAAGRHHMAVGRKMLHPLSRLPPERVPFLLAFLLPVWDTV